MVTFSKKIPVKYQELDYSGVIQNYHWIQNSLLSEFKDVEIPNIEISFKMGDISCSCVSIEEFSTHAYEQSIDVYMYNMHFYKKKIMMIVILKLLLLSYHSLIKYLIYLVIVKRY